LLLLFLVLSKFYPVVGTLLSAFQLKLLLIVVILLLVFDSEITISLSVHNRQYCKHDRQNEEDRRVDVLNHLILGVRERHTTNEETEHGLAPVIEEKAEVSLHHLEI